MLKNLIVKNFAVIQEASLDFSEGLNVLTGETGAGKSILVEALGFLLGERASTTLIRAQAERLEVEGSFDASDLSTAQRSSLEITEDVFILKRELDSSGKTRAFLNSRPIALSQLSALAEELVDFHGQDERQTLLKSATQLDLLDRFAGLEDELSETAKAYDVWARLEEEAKSLQISDEDRSKKIDLTRYALEELGEAALVAGEEAELEASLPVLKNAERLKGMAGKAYEILHEQEDSLIGGALKVQRTLFELAKMDPSLEPLNRQFEEARIGLEEAGRTLAAYADEVDASPQRLDEVFSRIELLARLKKKHGAATEEDLIALRDKFAVEIGNLEHADIRLAAVKKELAEARARLESACGHLSSARAAASLKLERLIVRQLSALGMPKARFSVSVEMEAGQFTRKGSDRVTWSLAANPGEPLKAIRTVASGGELSRVMLAIKTVLAKMDKTPILVFDEVDAGVGGVVAREVGKRLADLGKIRQVLCVTHLPQVASFGKTHFSVVKETSHGHTSVSVSRLEGGRRLEVLASMLGGLKATEASRAHAQELLESSFSEN